MALLGRAGSRESKVAGHAAQRSLDPPDDARRTPLSEDDGIDLIDLGITLASGWKTIVGVMVLAGIVGLIAVSGTDQQYRATAILRPVAADQPRSSNPLATVMPEDGKVDASPALLEKYASVLLAEENVRGAAEDARLSIAASGGPDSKSLSSVAAALPAKDGSGVQVSVTWDNPADATRLLNAFLERGTASIDVARRRQIDAVSKQLTADRDEVLKAFVEKQRKVAKLRRENGIDEKQDRLVALSQALVTTQQAVVAAQTRSRVLEARIKDTQDLLKAASAKPKEGQESSDRRPELYARLAVQGNASPLALHELEAAFGANKVARGCLQLSLAQNQVALRDLKRDVEQNESAIASILQQMATLRSELANASNEFQASDLALSNLRDACATAAKALRQWQEQAGQRLPVLVRDDSLEEKPRRIGASPMGRMVLIEMGALVFGCVVVIARSAYRQNAAKKSGAGAGTTLWPSPTRQGSLSQEERVSA